MNYKKKSLSNEVIIKCKLKRPLLSLNIIVPLPTILSLNIELMDYLKMSQGHKFYPHYLFWPKLLFISHVLFRLIWMLPLLFCIVLVGLSESLQLFWRFYIILQIGLCIIIKVLMLKRRVLLNTIFKSWDIVAFVTVIVSKIVNIANNATGKVNFIVF